MSRYAGYTLGLMEFKVDNVDCRIKPEMKDVDETLRLLAKARTENILPLLDIKKFCINLLLKGLEEEEKSEVNVKKELEEFVTLNLLPVWLEIQIAFRMIDREKMNEYADKK